MAAPALEVSVDEPYTVDDLFDLPEDGRRHEVLGGTLVVSPAPTPKHQVVSQRLAILINREAPDNVQAVIAAAVRLVDDDGPVPDVSVTTAEPMDCPRGLPVAHVFTVVEVVSPSNAKTDRMYKPQLYADAGIPCYWRVELSAWKGYRGPTPLVIVRLREPGGWREVEAVAGAVTALPLVVGVAEDGTPSVVTVELDPAELVAPGKR